MPEDKNMLLEALFGWLINNPANKPKQVHRPLQITKQVQVMDQEKKRAMERAKWERLASFVPNRGEYSLQEIAAELAYQDLMMKMKQPKPWEMP